MNFRHVIAQIKGCGTRLKHLRAYDGRFEFQLQEITVLRKIVETLSVDCIFDIGANEGQYARMLRRKVGYRGHIVSVEPNPEIFGALRREAHSDEKWRVENIALGDHDGEQSLSIMAGHQFSSLSEPIATEAAKASKVSNLNTVTKRITVPVRTLKTFYSEMSNGTSFNRPFLKMDTQGYDAVIADSAGETLREFVGIQTEVSFVRLYSDSISFQDSLELYADRGFTLCAIVPNNAGHFPYLLEQDAIFLNNSFLKDVSLARLGCE